MEQISEDVSEEDVSKLNVVNVGRNGTFDHPRGDQETAPQDVLDIFTHLEKQKIVIYFHGGMVTETRGYDAARIMVEIFSDEDSHPVTFAWETGVDFVVRDLIDDGFLNRNKLVKFILKKVRKKIERKFRRTVSMLTDDDVNEKLEQEEPFSDLNFTPEEKADIDRFIQNKEEFARFSAQLEKELDDESKKEDKKEIEEVLDEWGEKQYRIEFDKELIGEGEFGTERLGLSIYKIVKLIVRVFIKVTKRLAKDRNHSLYPTIIEEILRGIKTTREALSGGWKLITDKAEEMMQRDGDSIKGNDLHVGDFFLKQLSKYVSDNPDISIDLVGHSAGSIAIYHMLKRIKSDYTNIKIRNVIFLAPALRCDKFYEMITEYRKTFESFRMFTMRDSAEKKNKLVPLLYPWSILYFISGLLEEKGKGVDVELVGMDRHISLGCPERRYKEDMVEKMRVIKKFLHEEGQNRVVLTPTGDAACGLKSNVIEHKEFDNDPDTLDSITCIVRP